MNYHEIKIVKELKLNPDQQTIIYAPTWHGVGRINLSSIPDLGLEVCQAAGSEVNFIFKPHPNVIANDEFPEAMEKIAEYIKNIRTVFTPIPISIQSP